MNSLRKIPLVAAAVAAIVTLALAGCSEGGESLPTARATLGAAGGTLTGPDGVQLVVPPGALNQDTTLTITRLSAPAQPLPEGYTATTAMYEFTPHGQVFAAPVTLRMPVRAPAQADHVDVFMANPGEPWASTAATVAAGVAEWQRSSLSFGVGATCLVTSGQDPYRCTWAELAVPVVATPSSAMVTLPVQAANVHAIRAEAQLRFTLSFSAARDCANPSVRIVRAGRSTPLLDQPVSLTPSTTNALRSVGTTVFDTALGYADNGVVTLSFNFVCTRPGGQRQAASTFHQFQVSAPQPPAGVAPEVQTQPIDQTVTAPDSATFSASATGTPAPTWQWERSSDGGANWVAITGATGASYTTPPTSLADDGLRLRAVATNATGRAITQAVRLTVRPGVTAPAPFLGSWPTPTQVAALTANVGGLLREMQLACSRTGSCMAVWARISSNSLLDDGIYAARFTSAGGWGAPLQLSGDRGRQPALGVDDEGNAVVVWNARDGANIPQAYVRRYAPSTGWDNVAQLSPPGPDRAELDMAVAMSSNGHVTVVYTRRLTAEGSSSLWAARPSGGSWASVRVPGAGSAFGSLQGFADRLGRVTLVWQGVNNTVLAASAAADGSWTTAVDLSGTRQSNRSPRGGIDVDGQAFVVWQEAAGTPALHLRRRPAGAAWEPAQVQSFPAGSIVDEVQLAAGPAGEAAIVHLLDAGNVVLRGYTAAGGWAATATTVAAGNVLDGDLPRISFDTGGNTTVMWRGNANGAFALYARSFAPGLGWLPLLSATPAPLATIEQTYRENVLVPVGDGRAAMLFLRTNPDFFDELLGAVQTP